MTEFVVVRDHLNDPDLARLVAENDRYKITICYDGDYKGDKEREQIDPKRLSINVNNKDQPYPRLCVGGDGTNWIELGMTQCSVEDAEELIKGIGRLIMDADDILGFIKQYTTNPG